MNALNEIKDELKELSDMLIKSQKQKLQTTIGETQHGNKR
jgi:hypothetical protein